MILTGWQRTCDRLLARTSFDLEILMIPPDSNSSPAIQRILTLLSRKSNMSASDISREAFVGLTTLACGGYLKALRTKRQVHVSGWRKTSQGFVTPLFSLGDHPDLPRTKFTDEDRDSNGMRLIVAALEKYGRLTYLEASKASGVSANTIKNARYMDILVKQKRVHIAAWRRNKAGPMVAVYAAGDGEPAEKPAPLSSAEKSRRSREKKRVLTEDRCFSAQLSRL